MSKKFVYLFSEGNASMKNLLGGKGANLAEMTGLGLPVPQGFTITTEACTQYYEDSESINEKIENEIYAALEKSEEINGKKFGDIDNPFLVSVRSGARVSMPGMMDTILNLGLNDKSVFGLTKLTGNERFALDSYRRFIQMFSDVVMDIEKHKFEEILASIKKKRNVENDTDLNADDLREVVERYKALYLVEKGDIFPQNPKVQLIESVKAVFRSWDNPRAIIYRRMNGIGADWGTAVNVQSMVFGNMGNDSGTGVAFTRDPSTGEKKLYGEYLMNAQGEDVVAGIRTPLHISELEKEMPKVYKQFSDIATKLENHYRDMQDMEFTIEKGELFMLQTRNGKRTAESAIKIAVDLVKEGKISQERLEEINQRTRDGGAEIVKYLEKGSAFYAPAASGVQMAEAYLNDEKKLLPCAIQLNGEYGVSNVYAGVPVIIGKDGVEKIEQIDLDDKEKKEFMHSIDAVKALWEAASKIDSDLSK